MRRWMTAVLWLAAALPLSAQYNVKRLMEEGRRQLDMGYYVVAMQVFERIAAMKPHQYEAWYLSALCKYRLEDFKGATEDGSRALALQPDILCFDEPTSALDPVSTLVVEQLACELKETCTLVVVTHNMQQAARISDSVAFFLLGELVEHAPTAQLFKNPTDPRTADYLTGRFG